MTDHRPSLIPAKGRTILCVASYFKGNAFLEQCKREGCHVILLTLEPLLSKPWAREFCDEVFAVHSMTDLRAVVNAVSYLARTRDIARIVPLDDYDVEIAAHLREHLRIPGMGETTARYFRDKLAMRARAKDRGIDIPEFVHVLNHAKIHRFLESVPGPWLLKPRSEASSVGIKKFERADDVWKAIEELGDQQSSYLVERMIPGDVLHVDSIVSERQVVFAEVHQYRKPLFELMHQGGGIFCTRTVPRGSELERDVLAAHAKVVEHLNLVRGVTHTEFIRGRDDGKIYFLETAARVGGAHIADLVEASTGLNPWREWAKIEISQGEEPYEVPEHRKDYAGLVLSLARQEKPDTSAYDDPEIVWRLDGHPAHHVGLIVRASTYERVEELLSSYEPRMARDFMAVLPAPTSATS
ncbi:Putative nikkomycin biosynthesis protein, carboxylase [Minicystis rosea]|nr:Putative nikkomycin biosynthesis protein, carboxylase [Minicystis rosea]